MAFQFDANGLTTETREEIVAGVLARLHAKFTNRLNVLAMESVSSEWAEILAEILASYQQVVLKIVTSFDPNSAEGVALDQRAALTGSVRKSARQSTVSGVLTASGVCNIPDGTVIVNDTYETRWVTTGGPYVFGGAGTLDGVVQSVDYGPIVAQAGDTWTPAVSIANFTGFTNPDEDADLGELQESNKAFRNRRITELFSQGNGPLAAITATVSKAISAAGIARSVRTYHNPNVQPVDSNGTPWKATRVVVDVYSLPISTDHKQLIWDALLVSLGGGGWAWASDAGYWGTSTDVEGNVHPVGFDVVEEVDVWLKVNVTTGGDGPVVPIDPEQMADLIREACVEESLSHMTAGKDFRALTYSSTVGALTKTGDLQGIEEIEVLVGLANPPTLTSLVSLGILEKINFDTSRCLINIDGVDY